MSKIENENNRNKELAYLLLNLIENTNSRRNWEEVVKYARMNGVIIPILRYWKEVNDSGENLEPEFEFTSLFNVEEQKFALFWQNAHEIHRIFSSGEIDYALIKTNKVYEDYNWDINILVRQRDWSKSLKILRMHNWKKGSIFSHPLAQSEPNKTLLERKASFPIHLHSKISWNGLEYIPAEVILSSREEVNGLFFPNQSIDTLIYCAQSVFENYRLTLGEIYQLMHTSNQTEDIALARKYKWSKGSKLAFNTAKQVWNSLNNNTQRVQLPYKYKFKSLLEAWSEHAWAKGFGPFEIAVNLLRRSLL